MEHMRIFFDKKVQELVNSFAYCFNVRITLLSSTMEDLVYSFQDGICEYCQLVREKLQYNSRCTQQNKITCTACEQSNIPLVYQCYAGLTEAVIPIRIENRLIGYAMLGQFRRKKKIPYNILHDWRKKYPNSTELQKTFLSQPYYEELAFEKMINLFDMLCSHIVANDLIKYRRQTIVENVTRWIEMNISQSIKLDNAANTLGYSRSSISHTIKKTLHMSFIQLCTLKKIERFESLLRTNPTLSIKEAAFLVGYDDPLYFSRLYKKVRSVSPFIYLKSIQNTPIN